MPNHVTHRLIFDAAKAEEIFAAIRSDDRPFDFEKLVPSPPQMYHGNISSSDEQDFPCNWNSWSRENWGTKWNAYDASTSVDGDKATIEFDTAWSIPYPVIAAFCNRFQVPFEHRYFDEGHNFWGIETWEADRWSGNRVTRHEKRYKKPEDKNALCIELKGYDPDAPDEDAA